MKEDFEKKYHDVEQAHWWFKSRRNYILGLLKNAPKSSRILDIGCSSGILLNELNDIGFSKDNLFGIDISGKAIANCKEHGLENTFVMDAQSITLSEKFDIIIASDCLEHLQHDDVAIKNWHHLLKPGGELYVFVPAFMSLWSNHDVVNMHYRRYTSKELNEKLLKENFSIVKSGYWNFFLFIPVYFYRGISRMFKKEEKNDGGDIHISNTAVNTLLTKLISVENRLLKSMRFPFGVSTFCIVKK
jgi:SAM-dependent methyltransferase